MSTQEVVFYSSENGDEWLLLVGEDGAVTVRHSPNAASGGQKRDVDLNDFLSREQNTPQNQALLRILETLDLRRSSSAIENLMQAAKGSRRT
ncbi:hypothetical protein PRN20_06085 [Devosia sp. ZB163]|uniref:hypothetical protein n=1 Tax=Devosia sp. ZB163 TaxID=3025938 RepID=UPI0023629F0C|nr:hypothetical protein [Devosia sp. ZB163]MDC9823293.1 hypothetical protein [Devosia sp. ZB163]